ncbi:3-dehydroquinate synthase [Glycocaulis sp.]|uniref:3-dehydroquinate synthase n=1 Tax=Glycocaulis sp. TaxID=1969725 RepID=UPI003D22F40A
MSELFRIPVEAASRAYEVLVGANALEAASTQLAELCPAGRAIIVADRAALEAHRARLENVLAGAGLAADFILLDGGEGVKSWDALRELVEALLDRQMARNESLIAFGGGTVGDLAGFAASIMKRGCGFIQMPTTLLAQVDSSVGGKTGINTSHGKNLVGSFYQPDLVVADSGFLESLPRRELAAGYAEIVKAGLIADKPLFERLEAVGGEALALERLVPFIADAVRFKARIVAEDEREGGVRALLNLGHTFAHAFEAEAKKGALIHGEAVSCGIVMALKFSASLGLCGPDDARRAAAVLGGAGLPVSILDLPGGPYGASALPARMGQDKKNAGSGITLILARAIGEAFISTGHEPAQIEAFLTGEV